MAITNPTKYVTVRRLERFKAKLSKSDVGLSNVGNFKAVSTVAEQGLSSAEQANARTNIGAAPASTTYTKTEVDTKIADVNKKYMVTVDGHKAIFSNSPATVNNHKIILVY